MTANSKLVKYNFTDKSGNKVNIPSLYIDELTGIFYVRVYDDGDKITRSLGTKSFTLARQKLPSAVKNLLTEEKEKRGHGLIKDYYPLIEQSMKDDELSGGTHEITSISWRHHIEPFWGNLREDEFTKDKFSEFLAWHRKTKKTLLFNPLKLLRKIQALLKEDFPVAAAVDIKVPKREADLSREEKGTYVSRSEFAKIQSHLKSTQMKLKADMAYHYGFRLGELVHLNKARVKNVKGRAVIHLGAANTKTRRERQVPLNERTSALLFEQMKNNRSPWVFPSRGNHESHVTEQAVDRAWKKAVESAKIYRRVRFHDLRHSCATNFADMELPDTKACAILGMSLRIYSTVYVKKTSLDLSSVIDAITLGEELHEK